ncbi:hypothetical protein ACHWQZ_G009796 [Mnemiopsis leidyi]
MDNKLKTSLETPSGVRADSIITRVRTSSNRGEHSNGVAYPRCEQGVAPLDTHGGICDAPPQVTVPATETDKQKKCEYCEFTYLKSRQIGTHMRKRHPQEWNDIKRTKFLSEKRQKRWLDEDFELLCIGQEEYQVLSSIGKQGKGINQYIQTKYFPTLSTDAIKSQRKSRRFSEYSEKRSRELQPCNTSNDPEELPNEAVTENSPLSFDPLDRDVVKKISSKDHGDQILLVQEHLINGRYQEANTLAKAIFEKLSGKFPNLKTGDHRPGKQQTARKVGKKRVRGSGKKLSPSKQKRRELYAIVQKQWRTKKRSKVINQILTGNLNKEQSYTHTPDQLAQFWSTLFGRVSPRDDRPINHRRSVIPELDKPLSVEEVEAALKGAKDAATGIDGVPISHLKHLGSAALTILYNGLYVTGSIPDPWKRARTILIPKSNPPASPGDYRPISISSYFYRIYTSTISKRLASAVSLDDRQKGFIKEDGIRDNLSLIDTLINETKAGSKSLFMTFMDVKKAFDSVSHFAIARSLEWAGVPDGMRSVIADLYQDCTTDICGRSVKVTRGVKQGDPLSSTLFNLVIEMVMSNVPERLGIQFQGHRLFYLAFADDLVLLTRGPTANQKLVSLVHEQLARVGLELHPGKCKSIAIMADPKRKTTFVDQGSSVLIGGEPVSSLGPQDWYKYLGIKLGAGGMPQGIYRDQLADLLAKTDSAPLKPQQRLYILRSHILPKFNHRLMFERVTCQTLEGLDKLIRTHVRKWLKLPKDTPGPAFYADKGSGGLGLITLRYRVPLLKLRRHKKMADSPDPVIRLIPNAEPTISLLARWTKMCSLYGKQYQHKSELSKIIRDKYWTMCDGKGLRTEVPPDTAKKTLSLLFEDRTPLKPGQLIGAIGVRLNTLGTPARNNRAKGYSPEANICDKCPGNRQATLGHISQTCPATHGRRVKRHDKIVNRIAKALKERGSVKNILTEPHLRHDKLPLRKPDLIVHTEKSVEIIDVQVVADQGISRHEDEDQQKKIVKYDVDGYKRAAYKMLGIDYGSIPCNVSAFTITWRGNLAPHSLKLASRLQFTPVLKYIVADSLVDTWGAFLIWGKTS